MKKHFNHQGSTLTELLIVVVLTAVFITFAMVGGSKVTSNSRQTHQISNAKHISLACALFATENGGLYPNGNYDPTLKKITGTTPATTAEACFNDLIQSKKLVVEKVFWSLNHPTQCSPSTPNENGTLTAGENCWDYIAGLNNSSKATLPLVFEASDGGNATIWTKAGGHPWANIVVVGFVDGSCSKENLNTKGEIKIERDGILIDLCLPTPGKNKWPDSAQLTPATPIP